MECGTKSQIAVRLMRYDARGYGRSDAPEGGYAIETLGRDVRADGSERSIFSIS